MEFVALIEQWAWIGWLVLIGVFLVIEVLSLELTFLMIALGSVAGLVSGLFDAPIWLQVVIAALVAALLLLFLRPSLLRRLRRGEDATPSNIDALVHMRATVLLPVGVDGGQVKLANGETWTARSDGELVHGTVLSPGTVAEVIRVDGATVVVAPSKEERP